MKILISELNYKVNQYLLNHGLTAKDAKTLTQLIIEQELVGNEFSPVGELPGKHARLFEDLQNTAPEEIVITKPALKLIKGNGRLAPIITADHLNEAITH